MNKLKLMYDIAKKMKDKESVSGTLGVRLNRDQKQILAFDNEFEKNKESGRTRAKIHLSYDYEGKSVNMDNSFDFTSTDGFGHHDHSNARWMHMHKMSHMHGMNCGQGPNHMHGLKGKVNGLMFLFGVLNSINVEEKEDGSAVLTLTSKDIPEEILEAIHERMEAHKDGAEAFGPNGVCCNGYGNGHENGRGFEGRFGYGFGHGFGPGFGPGFGRGFEKGAEGGNPPFAGFHGMQGHVPPGFVKDFKAMSNKELSISVTVSPEKEITKALVTVRGENTEGASECKELAFTADLSLK